MTHDAVQRACFVLHVKPDQVKRYRELHADVWPEMRAALSRHGWHNYSLFLREDGLLIGYVETPDFRQAVAAMQSESINTRWQILVKDLFEPLAAGAADTSMAPIPQVFYLP